MIPGSRKEARTKLYTEKVGDNFQCRFINLSDENMIELKRRLETFQRIRL